MPSNQRKDKREITTSSDEDEPLIKRLEKKKEKHAAAARKRKATRNKNMQEKKRKQEAYLQHLKVFASSNFSPAGAYGRVACPKSLVDGDRIDGGRVTGYNARRMIAERITCQTEIADDLRRADGTAPQLAHAMKMLEEDEKKMRDVNPEQDCAGRRALCLQSKWGL